LNQGLQVIVFAVVWLVQLSCSGELLNVSWCLSGLQYQCSNFCHFADNSRALPLFLENIILSPLKFHAVLVHTSPCMEMIYGYLDIWLIHLVYMKFTNFITLYHMVHIEDSVAWCLLVICAVEKQCFLIRTVSFINGIRWSICGHSSLYCSESSSHVAYKFHQLVCFSQPSWRVILWLLFTPCINTSMWAVWLVSVLSPSAVEKYGNVSAVLFNCHGKSLFINSTQYMVLLMDKITFSNFALFSRHIASVNSKR